MCNFGSKYSTSGIIIIIWNLFLELKIKNNKNYKAFNKITKIKQDPYHTVFNIRIWIKVTLYLTVFDFLKEA